MLQIEWVGTDGSVWDLINGDIVLSNAGITGLGMPNATDQVKTTAGMHGQRFQGWKLNPRDVFLPFVYKAASYADVDGMQRAFWRSMAIGEYGQLRVTDGLGHTRSLDLRFATDNDLAYALDPYSTNVGYQAFGVNFIADQPFWQGDTISTSFTTGVEGTATFFGNGSNATPFYIVKSGGQQQTTLINTGEYPAWLTWELTGEVTEFSLGVNGHYVGGAITVEVGETLTVQTDPLTQVATLNTGQNVTRYLTTADFAPLPVSNDPVPVDIVVTGTGLVTASFRPQYLRAF